MFVNPKAEGEALQNLDAELKKQHWDGIMIGGGVRMSAENTILFEKIVQMIVRETKGETKLMFSARPDQIMDVLFRNFPEMSESKE